LRAQTMGQMFIQELIEQVEMLVKYPHRKA
jgi:hypothetical protein